VAELDPLPMETGREPRPDNGDATHGH